MEMEFINKIKNRATNRDRVTDCAKKKRLLHMLVVIEQIYFNFIKGFKIQIDNRIIHPIFILRPKSRLPEIPTIQV
jgi:hypothetical protein